MPQPTPTEAEEPVPDAGEPPVMVVTPPPPGPTPEDLAVEQKRLQEEADRREQEAQALARKAAFRGLRDRLEKARRLPLEADVNVANQREQPIKICSFGDAEVEVDLPALPKVALGPGDSLWQLSCKGPKGGPWSITATPAAEADTPLEIARVEAKQGELTLTLAAMPAVVDGLWIAAREALTTAPLLLRLPGETSQEFETFVQLCVPKRLNPIPLEGLLTDKKWLPRGAKAGATAEIDALPTARWPLRLEFTGVGPAGIRGVGTAHPPASRGEPAAPVEVGMKWIWSAEESQPFMETTFTMANRAADPTTASTSPAGDLALKSARVLPPWDGWQRLGPLKDSAKDAKPVSMQQLPFPLPKELGQGVPLNDEIPLGIFADYSEIARQYVPKLASKEVQARFAKTQTPPKPLGLEGWRSAIRRNLATTPGYQRWVTMVAPPPPSSRYDAKGNYIYLDDRERMEERNDLYRAAGPEVVTEFWESLKQSPDRFEGEKTEVILCCLHFELEPVLAEKRKARQLLEAAGEGTVQLTGRVWARHGRNGTHDVLLAEFGPIGTPEAAARRP
jgi:hypothetical protein